MLILTAGREALFSRLLISTEHPHEDISVNNNDNGGRKILVRMTAEARSKKTKTPRQKFLSAIMSHTSGDAGEEMAQAFAKGKVDKLRELLEGVVDDVCKKAGRNG